MTTLLYLLRLYLGLELLSLIAVCVFIALAGSVFAGWIVDGPEGE